MIEEEQWEEEDNGRIAMLRESHYQSMASDNSLGIVSVATQKTRNSNNTNSSSTNINSISSSNSSNSININSNKNDININNTSDNDINIMPKASFNHSSSSSISSVASIKHRLALYGVKLQGRKKEIEQLRDIYHRFINEPKSKAQLVIVEGIGGIGKTRLIDTIRSSTSTSTSKGKSLAPSPAPLWVKGHFHQFKSPQPFSAILDTLTDLFFLISQHREKHTVLHQMDQPDIKLFHQLIPDAAQQLFGPIVFSNVSPTLSPLSTSDDDNNNSSSSSSSSSSNNNDDETAQASFVFFRNLIHKFLKAVSCVTNLVVCLEDVHFADPSSLQVIQKLLQSTTLKNIIFLFSIRSDHRNNAARMMSSSKLFSSSSEKLPIETTTISLGPMNVESIEIMLAEILTTQRGTGTLRRFAQVISHKTHGNPYSIIQFLDMLQMEDFLVFHPALNKWTYDIDKIDSQTAVCDCVHSGLVRKLQKLKPNALNVLIVAAFVGFQFTLSDLEQFILDDRLRKMKYKTKVLSFQSIQAHHIRRSLSHCERKGLIVKTMPGQFRFDHDAIQQACHDQVQSGADVESINYAIGMKYAEVMQVRRLPGALLYSATEHLNNALSRFKEEEDALQLIQMNYRATRAAFSKGAFNAGLKYAKVARDLMRERIHQPWQNYRSLALGIYNLSCELEYLTGNYVNTKRAFDKINAECSENPVELLYSTRVWCQCLQSQGCVDEAIGFGCNFLHQHLNEPMKKNPSGAQVALNTYKVKRLLKGLKDSELLNLPVMQDRINLETVRLIGTISLYALIVQRRQFFIVGFLRVLQFTIQQGISPNSPYAFAMYGCVCRMIGQLEDSVRFGKLALAMRDRVNHQESAARTTTIAYSMILHLKTSFRDLVGPFSQAFEAGLSIGNRGIAMLAAAMHSATLFNTGMNLERISNDMDALQSRVHSHGNPTDALTSMLLPYWQASLNLMGASAHPIILSGEAMQEETVVNEARETKNMLLLNLLFAAKIQVACYYGYWDIARGLYKEREMEATKFIKMNMVSFVLEFLGGLICFELHRKTGKRKYLKEGKQVIKSMEKYESLGCPNSLSLCLFLKAEEIASANCDEKMISSAYNKCIAAAATSFPHIAALAYERAATVLHERNWECSREVKFYIEKAIEAYKIWGARGKVQDLRNKYATYL